MRGRPIRDFRAPPPPTFRGFARPRPADRRAHRGLRCRAGFSPIELILILPLAFLFLLVIIQLGILLGNWQHVKEAAFAGARTAADLGVPQLQDPDAESVGGSHTAQEVVKDRVDRTLAAAGLPPSGAVRIGYVPPGDPSDPDQFGAVRVVVVMDTAHLAPNFLGFFGVSLVERRARSEIVCPHLGAGT